MKQVDLAKEIQKLLESKCKRVPIDLGLEVTELLKKLNYRPPKEDRFIYEVNISELEEPTLTYYKIARSFWELARETFILKDKRVPKTLEHAKFIDWVDPIRLLIEKDGHTIEETREVYAFLKKDDFWRMNIRVTSKLRLKSKNGDSYFDEILIRIRNGENRKCNKKSSIPDNAEALSGIIGRINET